MEKTVSLAAWGFDNFRVHQDIPLPGSPNRTVARQVLETPDGTLLVAEIFAPCKRKKQLLQSGFLEFVHRDLPEVHPFLPTANGAWGVTGTDGKFMQLRYYLPGEPLEREKVANAPECAESWADFLLKLHRVSQHPQLPEVPDGRFYFADYLPKLRRFVAEQMPVLAPELNRILRELQSFTEAEKSLPPALAHGDYHPGNLLMCRNRLSAVIDWEFCGWKCAGYDFALLAGCIGRDDPAELAGNTVKVIRNKLLDAGIIPDEVRRQILPLMAAIRLGWLGEWVNMGEKSLADGEISFINFLLDIRQ